MKRVLRFAVLALSAFVVPASLWVSEATAWADVVPPPPPSPITPSLAPPKEPLSYHQALPYPTLPWVLTQLVPSPEVLFGRQRHVAANGDVDRSSSSAFGLRWQATPLLWSFGVSRHQSRWRSFVVDPFARQSGSLELSTSIEYIAGPIRRLIARPGLRVYLPVVEKGESLSVSFGTSVYDYGGLRVAYDVGAYVLSGVVGLQLTVAPTHAPLAAIATLRLRYF